MIRIVFYRVNLAEGLRLDCNEGILQILKRESPYKGQGIWPQGFNRGDEPEVEEGGG